MIVVNLLGAPGAGKSTGAAYIFSKLKMLGINAELVTEYAKDKTWESSGEVFKNQAYIFGKQYFRVSRLDGKVDVVITDAPLLHSLIYNDSPVFDSFENRNYFVLRDKPYSEDGQKQTADQNDKITNAFRCKLSSLNIPFHVIKGNLTNYDSIVLDIAEEIHRKDQTITATVNHIINDDGIDEYEDKDDREALWEGFE